jgi:hypothetical protein
MSVRFAHGHKRGRKEPREVQENQNPRKNNQPKTTVNNMTKKGLFYSQPTAP